ncbi:MAG: alkaline phosphatase [Bacteroidales bacterium]|jgi:alkaline phosphatase|nr:alkaline phosphatase [Bacteroidales bacterium]
MKSFGITLKHSFLVLLLLLLSLTTEAQRAKYVFYFIGDGMGLAQVAATEAMLAARHNNDGFDHLNFSKFPVTGIITTHAANRLVTGSAAAGTALASGHKTNINRIGMNGDNTEPLNSIAYYAKARGKKVGIISSVSIDHATPAAFYAHRPDRNDYYEISQDLAASNFDFFGGGGFAKPNGGGDKSPTSWELAQNAGYTITRTRAQFDTLSPAAGKALAVAPRLGGSGAMPYAIDQTADDIPLAAFVEKAIRMLHNDHGFFIMCEEGKIDWACHANDAVAMAYNIEALAQAVAQALEFYQQHPDETLIIVTADHETGGLALGHALTRYDSYLSMLTSQKVSMERFAAIADSVFAIPEHNHPDMAMALVHKYYKLGNDDGIQLTDREYNLLQDAYLVSTQQKKIDDKDEMRLHYGHEHALAATATRILNNKAGLAWTTWSHTASPVPVYAIGAGAEHFSGVYDNTDVPKKVAQAMGIKMEEKKRSEEIELIIIDK